MHFVFISFLTVKHEIIPQNSGIIHYMYDAAIFIRLFYFGLILFENLIFKIHFNLHAS